MEDKYIEAIRALNRVINIMNEADPNNKKKDLLAIKNQVIMYKNYYEELIKTSRGYKDDNNSSTPKNDFML